MSRRTGETRRFIHSLLHTRLALFNTVCHSGWRVSLVDKAGQTTASLNISDGDVESSPCYRRYIHQWSDRRRRRHHREQPLIGVYRDVWIAVIASSRTRLATLSRVMCNTSQCELRSLRVNSGMLNVIRIVTYYTLPPLESPTSSWIAMAYSR